MSARSAVRRQRIRTIPKAALEFPFTEADVAAISARLGEPEWLAARRLAAWETYQAMPMPTQQDDAWRRTDIRSLPSQEVALGPAEEVPLTPELVEPLVPDRHTSLLVLEPGRPARLEGAEPLKALGVIFCDWETAVRQHAELLKEHLGRVVRPEEGKFAALADAMAGEGVLVYVPPGVELPHPLRVVYWTPGGGVAHFGRVLLVVGKGASLTFAKEMASPTNEAAEAFHAEIIEVVVEEGAKLALVELQNWGYHVWNVSHERVRIEADGNLDWIFGEVGARMSKRFSELDLSGRGAQGRMSGFYLANGVQHFDHDTQQNHKAPNTSSDLLCKGVLLERSRSVWQGMIYVAPGAKKADGYQANRNLILSKDARVDSIPGLEILADDVRCTHGATVGQLEEEPIYYLMSRGISRQRAERLLIDGFFAPVMERLPFQGLRERLVRMMDEKLG
ncbi:MAG: Fe-S cluster assembly protein SufD [Anaerolineales bacterium]|jgi:Fe-S cluster assembly protein SufD